MSSSQWFQEAFDAPYLEVYAHRNQEEADQATACLLEPLGLSNLQVLDLACGAGRWLRPLSQAGARAVGVDLSLPLLERAAEMRRETQLRFDLLRCDMLHIPLRSNSCDLVLSMFTSFGYFEEPEQDIAVLREAHRVLRPGGQLFLDVFNAHRVRRNLVPETQRRAGRFAVQESRRIDEKRGLVIKQIELRAAEQTYRYREQVRLWESRPLQQALRDNGYRILAEYGNYDASPFSEAASPRLILHAEATRAATAAC
jgi:ubiquinone/menaquinone biosynthesis C-methylase UbiE